MDLSQPEQIRANGPNSFGPICRVLDFQDGTLEANCRLIALAPHMLLTIQLVVEYLAEKAVSDDERSAIACCHATIACINEP